MKTQNLKQPIVVILALNSDMGRREELQHLSAIMTQKVKPLVGSCKGKTENSYLLVLPKNLSEREEEIDFLRGLANLYDQESILYSDEYRGTWIINCETRERTPFGKLRHVSEAMAKQQDAWTFDPETHTYWIAG